MNNLLAKLLSSYELLFLSLVCWDEFWLVKSPKICVLFDFLRNVSINGELHVPHPRIRFQHTKTLFDSVYTSRGNHCMTFPEECGDLSEGLSN